MNIAQRSQASGEIAPALYARTDLAKYANALRTCRNFLVKREGGVGLRPGTDFCDDIPNAARGRLIPFIFNSTQAYVLEFRAGKIRVYQDGARLTGVELNTPYTADELPALNYVQSGDTMTIVHRSHEVHDLVRISSTSWSFAPVSFGAGIDPPAALTVTPGSAGPTQTWVSFTNYWVSSVSAATGAESVVRGTGTTPDTNAGPTIDHPDIIEWEAVEGASQYRLYWAINGAEPALLATTPSTSFHNSGEITLDYTQLPITDPGVFASEGNYPGVVGFYQQRKIYANSTNEPEKVWCSQSASYKNFNTSSPLQDTDAVIFALANQTVTEIRHLLDLGKLVIGAEGCEWLVEGDSNGTLTPFGINPRVGSYNGCSTLQPAKMGDSVLYLQSLGNKILELKTNILGGQFTFSGKDVGLYASHLLDGYTIVSWDYQQIPNYTTWLVRSDGTLLSLTYMSDEQFIAWSHHDTEGTFEDVCVIPEGGEHRAYVIVKRTINGATVRYVERLRPIALLDVVENASFLDSALEYDGRNTSALTMTISGGVADTPAVPIIPAVPPVPAVPAIDPGMRMTSGGDNRVIEGHSDGHRFTTYVPEVPAVPGIPAVPAVPFKSGWDFDIPLTLTCSDDYFTSLMVGDVIVLTGSDGTVLRFTVASFTSATVVVGHSDIVVPTTMRNVAIVTWGRAVSTVGGLEHLEGCEVAAFGDGFVASSPNNPAAVTVTVSGGIAAFDQAYEHLRVGLPYLGDYETLDIDTPSGPSLKETKIAITRVGLYLQASRGVFAGQKAPTGTDPVQGLREIKIRKVDDTTTPVELVTDYRYVDIKAEWNSSGRIFVRQVDPVPLNILAAMPQGFIP